MQIEIKMNILERHKVKTEKVDKFCFKDISRADNTIVMVGIPFKWGDVQY